VFELRRVRSLGVTQGRVRLNNAGRHEIVELQLLAGPEEIRASFAYSKEILILAQSI
jgi:hypothetical protein